MLTVPRQKIMIPIIKDVLSIVLNCICWYGSTSRFHGSVNYPFITTWYENIVIRFRQNPVRIENRVRDTHQIKVLRYSLMIQLAKGCKRCRLLALGSRYGARRTLLSEYMSLYLSLKLTTNCVPLLRIKWEVFFSKNIVSFR